MSLLIKFTFLITLLLFIQSSVYADDKRSDERGQLLYIAGCSACHTTQVHWRDKRLVTDWDSLLEQVTRWQYVANLNWTKDEITDVANYLNATYYKYRSSVQGKKPDLLMHKD